MLIYLRPGLSHNTGVSGFWFHLSYSLDLAIYVFRLSCLCVFAHYNHVLCIINYIKKIYIFTTCLINLPQPWLYSCCVTLVLCNHIMSEITISLSHIHKHARKCSCIGFFCYLKNLLITTIGMIYVLSCPLCYNCPYWKIGIYWRVTFLFPPQKFLLKFFSAVQIQLKNCAKKKKYFTNWFLAFTHLFRSI